ncbi:MAG: glycosyltransferase family 39 protein [Desulfobulbus sp.]|nr:glycosyltransferase family 39 protein [Desulfobulbus sp.]
MLSSRPRHAALFWACAVALLFLQLGVTATWQSEDRWLAIVREMIASGDYFHPQLNSELYFDKPLLSYWLIAAFALLRGALDEWALRVPSAIAGLIVLWATRDLAGRVVGMEARHIAGWVLLTCFGFLQWARLGEADMENLAACTLAVSWYWRRRDAMRFLDYLIFYLILSIGAQCKGLTAVVVPLLALLPDLLREQRWRAHLRWNHVGAAGIAAALYFLPFLLAPQGGIVGPTAEAPSGLGLVLRENITRYVAPFDHTGPIYTYLIALPYYLFPWSLVFIAALYAALRGRIEGRAVRQWLLPALVLIFAFFTLSGSRRNYYILPLLPYCALLVSAYLQAGAGVRVLRYTVALMALVASLLLLSPLIALWPKVGHFAGVASWHDILMATTLPAILALAAMTLAGARGQPEGKNLRAAIAGAAMLCGSFFILQQPVIDGFRTTADFGREVAALLHAHPDTDIAVYRENPGGRILFYGDLPTPVPVLRDPAALLDYAEPGPRQKLLLIYGKYRDELPPSLAAATPQVSEKRYPWEDEGKKWQAWLIPAPM